MAKTRAKAQIARLRAKGLLNQFKETMMTRTREENAADLAFEEKEAKWMKEARRWALHAYCYEDMVKDFPEEFERLFARGLDPYEAVDHFAENAALDRADSFYGINYGKKFQREM